MHPVSKAALAEHLEYNAWATALLLDACSAVPPDILASDAKSSHGGVLGTLQHIYLADLLWMTRLEGASFERPDPPPEFAALERDWPALSERYQDWIERASQSDIDGEMHSRMLNGTPFRLERWKVILHVVNHGTLHRGQIVAMLRQAGFAAPGTDVLWFYRARQAASGAATASIARP